MSESGSSDKSFLSGHSKGGIWDKGREPKGEDRWEPIDLGSGIFMLGVGSGNPGGNLGMLVGEEGVLLIDNGLEKAASMTLKTTEEIGGGPVNYLINTHMHGDHVACNHHYAKAGACIIAHENVRRDLLNDEEFDNIGLPMITFNDKASFHLNSQNLALTYFPNAHTDSDIIIHFTDANVIHAGDLFFNKVFPFVDLTHGGDLDGFIAAQRKVTELADYQTKIIPGHGPLGNKAEMLGAIEMLIEVKGCIEPLVKKGMSMEDVLKENPLAPFENWSWFHIPLERMTKIIYSLLKEN